MNMDQAQQRSENLQRAQAAVLKLEEDESISPLKLAAALDEFAELLLQEINTEAEGAATKARACKIRAEYYRKELENDSTSDLDLRAMLRQAAKGNSSAPEMPETITSIEDFDQLIAARSSSVTKGKKASPSRFKTLIGVMVTLMIIATIGGFVFMSQHPSGARHASQRVID